LQGHASLCASHNGYGLVGAGTRQEFVHHLKVSNHDLHASTIRVSVTFLTVSVGPVRHEKHGRTETDDIVAPKEEARVFCVVHDSIMGMYVYSAYPRANCMSRSYDTGLILVVPSLKKKKHVIQPGARTLDGGGNMIMKQLNGDSPSGGTKRSPGSRSGRLMITPQDLAIVIRDHEVQPVC